jgi:hypothetical protein
MNEKVKRHVDKLIEALELDRPRSKQEVLDLMKVVDIDLVASRIESMPVADRKDLIVIRNKVTQAFKTLGVMMDVPQSDMGVLGTIADHLVRCVADSLERKDIRVIEKEIDLIRDAIRMQTH